MGLGSFLVERQKRKFTRGLVSKVAGKGATSAYDLMYNLNRSKRVARSIKNRFSGSTEIKKAEEYKKIIEERKVETQKLIKEEKLKLEEGKKESTVKYAAESGTLSEMIKAEEEAEAKGVNSTGFKISKARDVAGLMSDLEKKTYPPVRVMVGLVRGYKEKRLDRNEFSLLEKLNRDPVSKPALDRISALL